MEVYTVFIAKGGAGKTTVSAGIVGAMAEAGLQVLGIDLNPQAHLCANLGVERGEAAAAWTMGFGSAILDELAVEARPNAWLLPANELLAQAEAGVQAARKPVTDFRHRIRQQWHGDVTVVDTSDHGFFSELALAAADTVVVPVPCRAKDVSAFLPTIEAIRNVRRAAGLPVTRIIVVPNMLDRRNDESERQLRALRAMAASVQAAVTEAIPIAVDIDRAGQAGRLLWEAYPRHPHADLLRSICLLAQATTQEEV